MRDIRALQHLVRAKPVRPGEVNERVAQPGEYDRASLTRSATCGWLYQFDEVKRLGEYRRIAVSVPPRLCARFFQMDHLPAHEVGFEARSVVPASSGSGGSESVVPAHAASGRPNAHRVELRHLTQ